MTTEEPTIMINGRPLTENQSATIRVALEAYAMHLEQEGLGDGSHGKAMVEIYSRNIGDIRQIMYD